MEEMRLPAAQLMLDEQNPRLPEELRGGSQPAILTYLYDNAVLEELARSYVNNGFFQHEHLVVAEQHDRYAVLEGNRRLAALKVLLGDDDAQDAELSFALEDELTPDRAAELTRPLPVFVVEN